MKINEPQAITLPLPRTAIFIVATVARSAESLSRVRDWCDDFAAVVRSVGTRMPEAGISCICGFGAEIWPQLFGQPPAAAASFPPRGQRRARGGLYAGRSAAAYPFR